MAGGTWESQNKIRAGVYIRFKSAPTEAFVAGSRGVVAIPEALSWGPVGVVTEVTPDTDLSGVTGYALTDPHNRFLQEMFKGTNRTAGPEKVLLYRLAGGEAAAATGSSGSLSVTANYPGVRGNDIVVTVSANVDTEDYTVSTLVDGVVVDTQVGVNASTLVPNAWVTFSGEDALEANTGIQLTGGDDGTVASAAYASVLPAIEPYDFNILCYDGSDATVMAAYQAFVQRIAEESGKWIQLVAANMSNPDSRYCINVMSGVTLDDGTVLTPQQTCWWVAGAEAGAQYNESLTYATYPGAVSVSPVLTNSQYESGLNQGQFLLFSDQFGVKVEADINTLITFTQDIGRPFRKNRCMRLCNQIANDIFAEFSQNYIGVVDANEIGRSRFKGAIVGYLLDIQANGGIQNFSPDDVEVLEGAWIDAVVVTIVIQPVDSAEKIYITVEVA